MVNWSHQVTHVLQHDSAQPLIDGLDVGPLIELDFWMKKKSNLLYIEEQLNSPVYIKVCFGFLLACIAFNVTVFSC